MTTPPQLDVEQLKADIAPGDIDTVIVAFTDMQGRLQGKRIHAQFFLDSVLGHGTEGCNYLLAVDVDMNTVDGYAISSWERGYGDMMFDLDLATLRRSPGSRARRWCSATCPGSTAAGRSASRRGQVLKAAGRRGRRARLGGAGRHRAGVHRLRRHLREAWDRRYHGLTPTNQYNVDYSILGGTRVEPLLRDIRNGMYAAGVTVESAKGECNLGQHEIAFNYDEVAAHRLTTTRSTRTAPRRSPPLHGKALTFMAKFNEREGNSCHIHLCLRGSDGATVVRRRRPRGWPQRAVRPLRRRRPGDAARADPALCAEHQLLQAVPAGLVRARPRWPGAGTTGPARCGWSGTAPACGSRTGCRAAT